MQYPRLLRPLSLLLAVPLLASAAPLTPEQVLGKQLFVDKTLSQPAGQSCASCHDKHAAFNDPIAKSPTSRGVDHTLFGPRNAPSAMYASFTPPLQAIGEDGDIAYMGGQFRDGRVDFLEDQAKGPFLNPIEMANPNVATVVAKVRVASYAAMFDQVYGAGALNNDSQAFGYMAKAIAAFERSKAFAPFSSKYDAWQSGRASLSEAEARGLALFNAADKANCASCHPAVTRRALGRRALFTDFGFDNIGVPRNPANRFYDMPASVNPAGRNFVDIGLGSVVPRPFTRGQFKAPSLRNVAVSGPYMHNGYFRTLRGVLDFYNTRDVRPACADPFTSESKAQAQGCWPVAEVPETVNRNGMGALGLSSAEIDDLLAFLETLTDGWQPPVAQRR